MRTSVKAIENKTLLANLRSALAPSSQLFTSAAPEVHLIFSLKSINPRNDKGAGGCKQLNFSYMYC